MKKHQKQMSDMDMEAVQKSAEICTIILELLISVRNSCNLSVCEAADIIHMDRTQLGRYESGETSLTLERFIYICQCYSSFFIEHKRTPNTRMKRLLKKYVQLIHTNINITGKL